MVRIKVRSSSKDTNNNNNNATTTTITLGGGGRGSDNDKEEKKKKQQQLALIKKIGLLVTLITCVLLFGIYNNSSFSQQQQSSSSSSNNLSATITANEQQQQRKAIANINDDPQTTSDTNNGGSTTTKATTTTPPTIGYAVSITGCGSDPLVEGAAVLKHSIHLASVKGNKGGRYDYKMYAIYHPNAAKCALTLAELGYTLLEKPTPVSVQDIQGEFLRTHIEKNGCCGEKELIKLYAYTLTDHPVVVHLDLDVLVLKPLDVLFDAIINDGTSEGIKLQYPNRKPFPTKVNAFYTRDYNMNRPGNPYPPMQGGFLVVRPDLKVYKEYIDIITKGDFRSGGGWGGKVGSFYGGQTIQGLVPYYYDILYPETFVELDHCEYNQMCINPRDQPTINDIVNGKCRTGEKDCQDCRSYPFEKVITTHYTLCQKPWWCLPHDADRIQERLCRKLLHAWYEVRSDLEKSWGRSGIGAGVGWGQTDHFFGYCKFSGKKGYLPIEKPYGPSGGGGGGGGGTKPKPVIEGDR